MKKNTKIWIGVGAFVMAGSGVAAGDGVRAPDSVMATPRTSAKADLLSSATAAPMVFAQAKGGESGGEGGEGKIDPAAVDADPIDYGIALQVIAAHYHAGLLAYENKQQEAGAQMFAHGLTEVYVELEEIFKKRGVVGLGDKLNAAVESATSKAPVAQVRSRVKDVMAALATAEKAGPKSDKPALAVKTEVMGEMLERAAAQYNVSAKSTDFESYLDGLGFTLSARAEAKTVMPWLAKQSPKMAAAMKKALDFAGRAYPGIKRPAAGTVDTGKFLAAASEARLAVSQLR